MSRTEVWSLAVLACSSLVVAAWLVGSPPREVNPNVPRVPAPDATFAAVSTAVRSAPSDQRQQLARAWSEFAWVIERDRDLRTTGALRAAITRFEELLFARTPLQNAFPGFSAAANAALISRLGAEDQPLDRAAAVAAFRDLALACDPAFVEGAR